MARSGSVDFTRTRGQIVQAAYRKCQALGEGQTLSSWKSVNGNEALDLMLKSWMTHGIHLWKIVDAAVFLAYGQASYILGSGATAARWSLSYVKTELAVAAVVTDGTIEVDDDEGMSDADIIGIVLDDETVHWTTINGAPVANVVTLTAAVAGDGAAIDQHVYTFTSRANRPLRVLAARLVRDGGNEIPIKVWARQQYDDIPNKTTTGSPTGVYYDPKLDNGTLKAWTTPATPQDYIIITHETPIEDMDQISNEPDFPIEWFEAIVYNLADRIAPETGLPLDDRRTLKSEAKEKLDEVIGFDREVGSVIIRPERTFRRRRQKP